MNRRPPPSHTQVGANGRLESSGGQLVWAKSSELAGGQDCGKESWSAQRTEREKAKGNDNHGVLLSVLHIQQNRQGQLIRMLCIMSRRLRKIEEGTDCIRRLCSRKSWRGETVCRDDLAVDEERELLPSRSCWVGYDEARYTIRAQQSDSYKHMGTLQL